MRKFFHVVAAALIFAVPGLATARNSEVRLEIIARDPAYGGRTFGSHGAYERIRGTAHMRIDPLDPANAGIVDIKLAPRAADGMVAYDIDVVIMRPINAGKARQVMIYEVVNRGKKLLGTLNDAGFGEGDAISPGNAFLLRQGYTLVWSGWQGDIAGPDLIGARLPIAHRHGRSINGIVATEAVFDNPTTRTIILPYPSAEVSQTGARLTVQPQPDDPRRAIPKSHWRVVDGRQVVIERSNSANLGEIYRFEYVARDPQVMGLGFAATRDFVSWLRKRQSGNPLSDLAPELCGASCKKLPDDIFATTIALGISQSGRYLRDFLWQGFNRDIAGRRVFDGMMPIVAGARRTFTNFRFAEPGRFSRQHEDHNVPGFDFPFTYTTLKDPATGRSDGLLKRCMRDDTCPQVFHVDTSAEFWQAGASLVGTGGTTHDVAFPANVRAYAIAGGAHWPGISMDACTYQANPMNYAPVLRSLLTELVAWTTGQATPPDSQWPRLADGDLQDVGKLKAPFKPWARVINRPIAPAGKSDWPLLVPAIDDDGNDRAGIRMPHIAAPLGTYLGWNLRDKGYGEGNLCFVYGSYVPFAPRNVSGVPNDSRRSLAERYSEPGMRKQAFTAATDALLADRLLLQEDAERLNMEVAKTEVISPN